MNEHSTPEEFVLMVREMEILTQSVLFDNTLNLTIEAISHLRDIHKEHANITVKDEEIQVFCYFVCCCYPRYF